LTLGSLEQEVVVEVVAMDLAGVAFQQLADLLVEAVFALKVFEKGVACESGGPVFVAQGGFIGGAKCIDRFLQVGFA